MAGSRVSDASLDRNSIYSFVNEMRKESCLFLNPILIFDLSPPLMAQTGADDWTQVVSRGPGKSDC